MQYTGTPSIPIWNYENLNKIVVTNSNTGAQFVLFYKDRSTSKGNQVNPKISNKKSLNLHDVLCKYQNKKILYGDDEWVDMKYITLVGDSETKWDPKTSRHFDVTYTFDNIDDTKIKPIQFILSDYVITQKTIVNLETNKYKDNKIIFAEVKLSQLKEAVGKFTSIDLVELYKELKNKINDDFTILDKIISDFHIQCDYWKTLILNINVRVNSANIKIIKNFLKIDITELLNELKKKYSKFEIFFKDKKFDTLSVTKCLEIIKEYETKEKTKEEIKELILAYSTYNDSHTNQIYKKIYDLYSTTTDCLHPIEII
jgi:hypothetical protein